MGPVITGTGGLLPASLEERPRERGLAAELTDHQGFWEEPGRLRRRVPARGSGSGQGPLIRRWGPPGPVAAGGPGGLARPAAASARGRRRPGRPDRRGGSLCRGAGRAGECDGLTGPPRRRPVAAWPQSMAHGPARAQPVRPTVVVRPPTRGHEEGRRCSQAHPHRAGRGGGPWGLGGLRRVRPRARYPQTVATWERAQAGSRRSQSFPPTGAPRRASPTGAGGAPSTNAIESLNYQLRKGDQEPRSLLSSDEAAVELLWPADPQQRRTRPRARQGPGQTRQQTHRPTPSHPRPTHHQLQNKPSPNSPPPTPTGSPPTSNPHTQKKRQALC